MRENPDLGPSGSGRIGGKFQPRDVSVYMQMQRVLMGNAISRWVDSCVWVSLGGRASQGRAWDCFREWAMELKKAEATRPTMRWPIIDPKLFHAVMGTNHAYPNGAYRLTISASFVVKPKASAKKPRMGGRMVPKPPVKR